MSSVSLITDLALRIGGVYAALLVVYAAVGLAVTRLNAAHPERRIQSRACPQARVRADRRQSVRSLLVISTFVGVGLQLQAAGWGFAPPAPTASNLALGFCASLVLFDTWFYWGHRLIHTRPLYARVHRWHHLSVTPTVWSNNSDSFLDNLVLQSYWLVVVFLFPIHPWALLAHKLFDQVTGMLGHAGFEHFAGPLARWPSPMLATVFHDQHHKHFTCNYATHFSVWDRLMGTAHPDYEAGVRRFEASRS